jgi:hypothetical protein
MAQASSCAAQALTDGNARPQQSSPLLGSRCLSLGCFRLLGLDRPGAHQSSASSSASAPGTCK